MEPAFTLGELLGGMLTGVVFGFFLGRDPDFVRSKKKKTKEARRRK